MYAAECEEYGEDARGRQILTEVVHREKRWTKEEIPELLAAYYSLLEMTEYDKETNFSEIIDELCRTVENTASTWMILSRS